MTSFETEVYNRSEEDVIGARVIVFANNGQQIDSIQITNKTQFDELKSKLDVLDSSYVKYDENSQLSGLSIDKLLSNDDEEWDINATLLGGLQSDQYSKTGHIHSKGDISDLYNYDLSLSSYNVNVGTQIIVTVKVTNMNNQPVANHNFSLMKNNVVWKNLVSTNSSGVYSVAFTPEDAGMVTFQAHNQKIQCNVVGGWKVVPTTLGTLRVNEESRLVNFYGIKSKNMPNANTDYTLGTIPSQYAPLSVIRQLAHNDIAGPKLTYVIVTTEGTVKSRSSSAHSGTLGVSWNLIWSY